LSPQGPKDVAPPAGKVAVPIKPALPKALPKDHKTVSETATNNSKEAATPSATPDESIQSEVSDATETGQANPPPPPPKAWSTPKAWSGVFTPGSGSRSSNKVGGAEYHSVSVKSNAESLAETLKSFDVTSPDFRTVFLEPRGLVNTGNMCYMNSVLQVLMFCSPFYSFLEQYGKRAAYSFKSETPMIDAM
jgi:ubiquitin carboxyl-terminal hydrolase 10